MNTRQRVSQTFAHEFATVRQTTAADCTTLTAACLTHAPHLAPRARRATQHLATALAELEAIAHQLDPDRTRT